MQFTIPRRWYSSLPQITVEIGAEYEQSSNAVRLGVAVMVVIERAKLADTRADLTDADLTDANLTRANLTHANLTDAVLTRANIPVIPNIDAAILKAIDDGGKLQMGNWHTCETTHCRAGWAIHLAGAKGYELQAKFGPAAAGALIYAVSRPGQRIPNFYVGEEAAMADIKACAAEQTASAS